MTVDAAGYRERREAALHRMADRAAAEALRYDRPVELEPMRAHERKIVHTYLSERTDVETHSEGDEPDRRLGGRAARLSVSRETVAELAALRARSAGAARALLEALAAEPDPHTTVADLRRRSRSTWPTASGARGTGARAGAPDRGHRRRRRAFPGWCWRSLSSSQVDLVESAGERPR